MTIHAAKGLEFEHVIVWHLVRRAFPTARRKPLIELPSALWKGPLPRGDFHTEEERRLFYVALTRARRSLVLTTLSNARQQPSLFVDELLQVPSPDIARKRPLLASGASEAKPAGEAVRHVSLPHSRLAKWVSAPVPLPPGEFTLSISQLETYLGCPLRYYFQRNWQIPVPPTAPLLFGNILHGALKEVVFTAANHPEQLNEQSIRDILERRWPRGGFGDAVQERKYKQLGAEQLEALRVLWRGRRMALLYQEMPFEIRLAGCKVVGRVDQIHRNESGGVELVEYKTGTPHTQKQADQSLQLTLYAKACREVLGLELSALVLYNLATQEAIHTTRSGSEFSDLERQVRETSRNIQAGRFSARPGYHCRFCAFRAICPAHEEAGDDPQSLVSGTIEPVPKMGPVSYCFDNGAKRQ
jgi:RecB family exonuclease